MSLLSTVIGLIFVCYPTFVTKVCWLWECDDNDGDCDDDVVVGIQRCKIGCTQKRDPIPKHRVPDII